MGELAAALVKGTLWCSMHEKVFEAEKWLGILSRKTWAWKSEEAAVPALVDFRV